MLCCIVATTHVAALGCGRACVGDAKRISELCECATLTTHMIMVGATTLINFDAKAVAITACA